MRDQWLYEICVEGRLDERWLDWLGPETRCEPADEADGHSRFVGRFDQSSLHGFLRRLPDLGVVLVSLRRLDEAPRDDTSPRPGLRGLHRTESRDHHGCFEDD